MTDIDSFLRDLTPQVVIETAGRYGERISQLIGKTNQFKLNGSTFSPVELRERADNVLALRLKDRLQDYGTVAVAVLRITADGALVSGIGHELSGILPPSRVLHARTHHRESRRRIASRIHLQYVESGRNGLVLPF